MVVAIQKTGSIAIKRIYARKNNNASSLALQIIFDKHIPKSAKILTDKMESILCNKQALQYDLKKSEPDMNFKVMNRGIQQLKSWIRGIHHSVDKKC